MLKKKVNWLTIIRILPSIEPFPLLLVSQMTKHNVEWTPSFTYSSLEMYKELVLFEYQNAIDVQADLKSIVINFRIL